MESTFGKRIQIAFWVMLFCSNLYLSSLVLGMVDATYRSTLTVVCHVVNFYGFYTFLVPLFYEKKKFLYAFLGAVALLAVLAPLRLFIENKYPLAVNLVVESGYPGRLGFVLFTEISIGAFASLMRLASNHVQTKQRLTELHRMHVETELRFLKAQMNPHFLFNTINNIYSLTLSKSDKAPDAVMKLSELLRYLLYESTGKVSLAREIQALHDYGKLFQLRFEKELSLSICHSVNEELLIEPMILLPILENALKHSNIGLSEGSYIDLRIAAERDALNVNCKNSKPKNPVAFEAGGIGLSNIRKRLEMAYEKNHSLTISETHDHFELNLTITAL